MQTLESAIHLFESLTDGDKAIVLALVAHQLTITARWVCTEGTSEQQRENLIALNEIQHNALEQMLAYLKGRKKRYSDRDIFLILVETAKQSGLVAHLQPALERALSAVDQTAGGTLDPNHPKINE